MLLGIHKHFHTLVEKGIGLGKIQDVKPDLRKLSCVLHTVEEPLGVTRSVHIVLKQHVVLIVTRFNCCC